jgi:hypothetical protein
MPAKEAIRRWLEWCPRPLRVVLFLVVFIPLLPLLMVATVIYWSIQAARHEFSD